MGFCVELARPLVLLLIATLSVTLSEVVEAGAEEERRMTPPMRADCLGLGELPMVGGTTSEEAIGWASRDANCLLSFLLEEDTNMGLCVGFARPLVLPVIDELSMEAGREIVNTEEVRRMTLPMRADHPGLGLELPMAEV